MPTLSPTQTRAKAPQLTPKQLEAFFKAKLAAECGPHDVKRRQAAYDTNFILLDVREREAFEEEHIKGAVNIPASALPTRLKELPKHKEIITYCWSVTCTLAPRTALLLASKGYRVKELVGGIGEWKSYGFPVEKGT